MPSICQNERKNSGSLGTSLTRLRRKKHICSASKCQETRMKNRNINKAYEVNLISMERSFTFCYKTTYVGKYLLCTMYFGSILCCFHFFHVSSPPGKVAACESPQPCGNFWD